MESTVVYDICSADKYILMIYEYYFHADFARFYTKDEVYGSSPDHGCK